MQDQFKMAATQQQTKTLKLFSFCLAVTSLFCSANMTCSISIALKFCLIKAHIHRNLWFTSQKYQVKVACMKVQGLVAVVQGFATVWYL